MERPSFRLAFLNPRYWPLWLGLGLLWLLVQLPYGVLLRLAQATQDAITAGSGVQNHASAAPESRTESVRQRPIA